MSILRIDQFQGKYRFLSNFWPAKVSFEGLDYPTVEHAYQASKTINVATRLAIQQLEKPGMAKRQGKEFPRRRNWIDLRLKVMEILVRQKFLNNPVLGEKLRETGDAELIEGNNWGDRYWGVDLDTGEGENNLGKILMRVREELNRRARTP